MEILNLRELTEEISKLQKRVDKLEGNVYSAPKEVKVGDVCLFYDGEVEFAHVSKLEEIDYGDDTDYPYKSITGEWYANVEQLTKETLVRHFFGEYEN